MFANQSYETQTDLISWDKKEATKYHFVTLTRNLSFLRFNFMLSQTCIFQEYRILLDLLILCSFYHVIMLSLSCCITVSLLSAAATTTAVARTTAK